jgi:hypothetical protein
VPGQPGAPGHLFARETYQDAGGMELRTGNSNQRHREIVEPAAISHNVNNFHQARAAACANDDSLCHRSASTATKTWRASASGAPARCGRWMRASCRRWSKPDIRLRARALTLGLERLEPDTSGRTASPSRKKLVGELSPQLADAMPRAAYGEAAGEVRSRSVEAK